MNRLPPQRRNRRRALPLLPVRALQLGNVVLLLGPSDAEIGDEAPAAGRSSVACAARDRGSRPSPPRALRRARRATASGSRQLRNSGSSPAWCAARGPHHAPSPHRRKPPDAPAPGRGLRASAAHNAPAVRRRSRRALPCWQPQNCPGSQRGAAGVSTSTKRHGCDRPTDGACEASASKCATSAGSTGSPRKRRTSRRQRTSSANCALKAASKRGGSSLMSATMQKAGTIAIPAPQMTSESWRLTLPPHKHTFCGG